MAGPFPTTREPHREPFFPIQAMHALAVDDPALPPQQDMQTKIPKPGSGLGEFAQPPSQRRIVPPAVSVIPRGPIALQKPTGPSHPDRAVSEDFPYKGALARGL